VSKDSECLLVQFYASAAAVTVCSGSSGDAADECGNDGHDDDYLF